MRQARTAGFLFAVTESGLLLDVMELIGAESLSQRYHFTAQCAHRLPSLRCIVHDDSCHLKAMCLRQREGSPLAERLANFDFIIDEFHASGRILAGGARRFAPKPAAERGHFEWLPNRNS